MRKWFFEFEDQPWFPAMLREYMTDYLNLVTHINGWLFTGFAKKLHRALMIADETHIVDLCSGGAGPLPCILRYLSQQGKSSITATLTDLYPNLPAFQKICRRHSRMNFIATPIDATDIPPTLRGFRTILNGFHHFDEWQARKILADAAAQKNGIAILEIVGISPFALLCIVTTPIFQLLLTPFIKPFSLKRLFFTYVVPLIPFFTLWDGIASCFRVYSEEALRAFIEPLQNTDYQFEIGSMKILNITTVTYVIGTITREQRSR